MADEQPNTLSADVTPSDVEGTPTGSDEQSGQEASGKLSWWDRLMGRRPEGEEPDADSGDQRRGSSPSKSLTLSPEELERKIQSETDRREAKRQQELRVQQRRELRDKDPWAFAEQERQEEQAQEQTSGVQTFFANVGNAHDRISIDPLVNTLPPAERERILALEGAGHGLDGRKLVVTESLKALEKHWKAQGAKDAEDRLRRNPAFRKQLLSEARGGSVEPELLPAFGASTSSDSDHTVSSLLRRYYDLPSPREHNSAG